MDQENLLPNEKTRKTIAAAENGKILEVQVMKLMPGSHHVPLGVPCETFTDLLTGTISVASKCDGLTRQDLFSCCASVLARSGVQRSTMRCESRNALCFKQTP